MARVTKKELKKESKKESQRKKSKERKAKKEKQRKKSKENITERINTFLGSVNEQPQANENFIFKEDICSTFQKKF